MRRLIIALLVLLALLFFAADMMAQQKFSLFDRAVAQGGSTVATDGSVLMVGAAGSILGKVWTGNDVSKGMFANASGLLAPDQGFSEDAASWVHNRWRFEATGNHNRALVSLVHQNVSTAFFNLLCLGYCDNETGSRGFAMGILNTGENPLPIAFIPYGAIFSNSIPSTIAASIHEDGIVATGLWTGTGAYSSDSCTNVSGPGFCIEDGGATPKARTALTRTRMHLNGIRFTLPASTLPSVGQVLTITTPCNSQVGNVSEHCALTWGTPTGGTVTSVGLSMPSSIFDVASSPVTGTGTLTVTLDNQDANKVFAGPTTGSPAAPGFRTLVAADIPVMVGDSGSGGTAGAVPAPATGDATKFLRGDGSFALPAATEIPSGYVEMTTQRTTTSGTLEDITGASTTITLGIEAHVAVFMNAAVSASGAAADLGLAINIDGTDHDEVVTHLSAGTTDSGVSSVIHRSASPLAAGTYTVKGRMRRAAGSGTPAVDRIDLLVVSLEGGGGGGGGEGTESPLTTKGDLWTYSTEDARLPVGADGKTLSADSTATTGNKWAGGIVQIARVVTSSSQASVDFQNIPSYFSELKLVWAMRSTKNATYDTAGITVNNDTTTGNYNSTQVLRGQNAAASAFASAPYSGGTAYLCGPPGATSSANHAHNGEMIIPDYAGTTFVKRLLVRGSGIIGTSTSANEYFDSAVIIWKSTAAINRLTINIATAFVDGSTFTLYGVGAP